MRLDSPSIRDPSKYWFGKNLREIVDGSEETDGHQADANLFQIDGQVDGHDMRAEGNDKRDKAEDSNDKTSLQSQHLNILGEILATRLATLKQTDFGMAPVTVAAGTVKVKDEAKIEFEIVLTK